MSRRNRKNKNGWSDVERDPIEELAELDINVLPSKLFMGCGEIIVVHKCAAKPGTPLLAI